MNRWKEYRISELGTIGRGKSKHRPRNDRVLYGGKYPFVQTGNVKESNFYINKHTETYNERGLAQSKLWDKGTLCITIAANIADTAILKYPACFPDSIIGFTSFEDVSDVRFVKYYFDIYKKHMEAISMGATQNNLSIKKLESLKFIFPSLETQKKIADVLSTYDELIENNNRRIEILEKIAEEIYKEWFVRMRFPGHENTKFEKGVPKGWKVRKVKNIASLIHGYTESANEEPVGPKYLRGTDINKRSYINWNEVPYCKIEDKETDKYKLQKNNIVIIRMADPGRVAIIEKETEAVFASYLIKINYNRDRILPYYMFYTLYSDGYQEHIRSFSSGTTRSSINSKMILNSKILVPNIQIQNRFNDNISIIRNMLNKLVDKNQNLAKQRDLLLPRLMNGIIEVN